MPTRFYQVILAYPKTVIAVILAVTLLLGWQATKVEFNSSIEAILPEDHPALLQDHEVKQVFDSREMILIGILNDPSIFHSRTLQKVADLTEAIWQVTITTEEDEQALVAWSQKLGAPYQEQLVALSEDGLSPQDRAGVNNVWIEARDDATLDPAFLEFIEELRLKLSPISDVLSLAQVDNITATADELRIDPPMSVVPASEDALEAFAATVYENEMFIDGLVARDRSGTLILVELSFYYDNYIDLAHRLFQTLEGLAESYRGPEEVLLAGVPMVNVYTSNYMMGDLQRLMPLVVLLVMLVMWAFFRTVKGALIPMVVVLVALVWTLGFMALFGRPITLVVSAMPIILIAIGVADGIHLITEYQVLWTEYRDQDQAILGTMHAMHRPIIYTSLTDMAGFGSLAISSIASIRDFGVFTSVGVLAALVFSLTFIPAVLKLMKPPPPRAHVSQTGPFASLLKWLGEQALLHRRGVVAGAFLIVVFAAILLPRIEVGSRMVGMFHEDSEIVQASNMINAKFGGTEVLNIVLDTGAPDGLKDPQRLSKIAALQDTLEAQPLVGYTSSLADYIKRINLVMHEADTSYNRIPAEIEQVLESDWETVDGEEIEVLRPVPVHGRDVIAQYLLLYENAGGNDVEKLADYDYQKANIIAQIRTDHTPHLTQIRQIAQDYAYRAFGPEAKVTFAGCSNLCIVADELIIPSQLKSLGLALVVVFVLLILIFRSFRYGVIGLLPLALTVLVVFGLLSLFGVYLDAITALIASIVLGIGIDYSIHFVSRYQRLRQDGTEPQAAVLETMHTSGRAILFNSLAVALGFLVLLFSSFWPVIHIGWMVAINMVLAALFTLVLLPAVLHADTRRKRPSPPNADFAS